MLCRKFFSLKLNDPLISIVMLVIIWILGLCFGTYCANVSSDIVSFLMPALLFQRLSISGMIFALFFPLVLSYTFCLLSARFMVFLLAFFKAVCFSYTLFFIYAYYGSCAWLIYSLLLFSEILASAIFLWLWIKLLTKSSFEIKIAFIYATLILSIVGLTDYFLIAPFLLTVF